MHWSTANFLRCKLSDYRAATPSHGSATRRLVCATCNTCAPRHRLPYDECNTVHKANKSQLCTLCYALMGHLCLFVTVLHRSLMAEKDPDLALLCSLLLYKYDLTLHTKITQRIYPFNGLPAAAHAVRGTATNSINKECIPQICAIFLKNS